MFVQAMNHFSLCRKCGVRQFTNRILEEGGLVVRKFRHRKLYTLRTMNKYVSEIPVS